LDGVQRNPRPIPQTLFHDFPSPLLTVGLVERQSALL
jgi:hypothetical protein